MPLDVLDRFLRPLRRGRVTSRYPVAPPDLAPAARGLPVLDAAACDLTGACAVACPTGAIEAGPGRWRLDAGRCVMCDVCVAACPTGALRHANGIELAARTRRELVVLGQPVGPGTPQAEAVAVAGAEAGADAPQVEAVAVAGSQAPQVEAGAVADEAGAPQAEAVEDGANADADAAETVAGGPVADEAGAGTDADGADADEAGADEAGAAGSGAAGSGAGVDIDEAGARLVAAIRRSVGRSLHVRHLDTGSCNGCDWEINALLNPYHDVQRFGIDFVASPRHADLLLVTGTMTRNLEEAAVRTYEAMPEPRLVVAVGACAIGGGVFAGSYAGRDGIGEVLPVDVFVPGCPPRPEALIQALLLAMDRWVPRA